MASPSLPTWHIRPPTVRCMCRMTGCAATRTATTKVGMGSAISASRMQELGIVDKGVNAADRLYFLPRSTTLAPAARVMQGRKMELYAAMVEYMDDQIGRVFDYLKEIGEYDNTVVIFISDNGAEGNDLRAMVAGQAGTLGFLHAMNNFAENGHNSLGRKGTYAEYGPAWAQVSMTPFRIYKGWVAEGGIRSPLIVSGPGVQGAGEINKEAILHVMDIARPCWSWPASSIPLPTRVVKWPRCRASPGWGCLKATPSHPVPQMTGWAGSCSATGRFARGTGRSVGFISLGY